MKRQFLHHRLPHQEFLRLPGDGHREGVDEADVARRLVVGDRGAAEGDDLVLVQARALAPADPDADLLAVLWSGTPKA